VAEVTRRTTQEDPPGETYCSTRTLALLVGLSHTEVHRIWRAHGLKPHRKDTFRVSTDPRFREKLGDIVGLYLNPPEKAAVSAPPRKARFRPSTGLIAGHR